MRYLLDTNILSDLVRNPQGDVAAGIDRVGELSVCTSIVVAAELRYGASKKGSARLTAQLEVLLAAVEIIPLEQPVDLAYGTLRADLERAGTPIGANDLLIAAQAISLGYTLVTDDRAFAQVRDLRLENWLDRKAGRMLQEAALPYKAPTRL